MVTQFPAFEITEIQSIFFEISWFPLLLVFFSLGFCYICTFDLAQVVLFVCFFFLPNHHHPRINRLKNLEIPLSRKDVLVNNLEGFNACDYFTWHYFEVPTVIYVHIVGSL